MSWEGKFYDQSQFVCLVGLEDKPKRATMHKLHKWVAYRTKQPASAMLSADVLGDCGWGSLRLKDDSSQIQPAVLTVCQSQCENRLPNCSR